MTLRAVALLTLLSFVMDVIVRNLPGTIPVGQISVALYAQGLLLSAMWWWFWLALGAWISALRVRMALAALVGGYWALIVVTDSVHLKYLGQHITAYSLRIAWHDPAYLLGYWNSFGGPLPLAAFFVLFSVIATLLFAGMCRVRPHVLGFLVPLAVVAVEVGHLTRKGAEGALSIEASLFLSHINAIKMNLGTGPRLHAGHRSDVVALSEEGLPRTVVLFVTESFGRHHAQWEHEGPGAMPRFQQWLKERGAVSTVQGFANASATDMSMPSIMTGLTPDQDSDAFHQTPLVWDYFAAAGYETGWFSSQRFSWAGFSSFFKSRGLSVVHSSESMGGRLVNDTGQDDMITVAKIKEWLGEKGPNERLFLVVNLNAAHMPCQAESPLLPPLEGDSACDRAMRILERGFMEVIGAVEQRSRDAVFVFTSDHGDRADNPRQIARIQSYFDEIIRIPIAMVLPGDFEQRHTTQFAMLKKNFESRQIMNVDLVATLADLLELRRFRENDVWMKRLSGHSLFEELPEDRWILAMNTGSIRTWSREGFGLINRSYRFLYNQGAPPELYDVSQDSQQLRNLWETSPAVRSQILSLISENPSLKRITEGHENRP